MGSKVNFDLLRPGFFVLRCLYFPCLLDLGEVSMSTEPGGLELGFLETIGRNPRSGLNAVG